MKVFLDVCIHSLKLPQKKAVFALNRIGMDITVIYLFILLAIASIPELINQLSGGGPTHQVNPFFLLIFFFIFYYLVLVLIVFSVLSIVAYIATLLTRMLDRKLRYSLLWKMTAFATTIPLLLYTAISFFYPLSEKFLLLANIYILFVLVKIILIYPKRVNRT